MKILVIDSCHYCPNNTGSGNCSHEMFFAEHIVPALEDDASIP